MAWYYVDLAIKRFMELKMPYHLYLDYCGYLIEPRSYRVMPAPLMGTRFATGRQAYANLDFWQVGAMTDFTHGINQRFLVDPSACFLSVGLDCSKPGEVQLERDLASVTLPTSPGVVTARYRSLTAIYLGTSTGKILKSINGINFTEDAATGTGKIYGFFEIKGKLFAMKGDKKTWVYDVSWSEVKASLSGTLAFTNLSTAVTGTGTKFKTELWPGASIQLLAHGIWVVVGSITDDTNLVLTTGYSGVTASGTGKLAVDNLYFAMVESDYGFGWFNDGVRRTTDGLTWLPIPPDPLWIMPSAEGIALNAISIPRGFVIGSQRGLWVFVGGSSGINLWLFPDYASANNFAGLDKWGHYAVFSIENQGIFYTDGVQVYPTNLNYLGEGMAIKSCKSIVASGWDLFTLVSDGTDWYLARCNLTYSKLPRYWWLVKKLSKEPAYLASFSNEKLYIFYADATAEVYNKISGPFQASGYLITSLIDENLIRLQKFYKAISAIFESFPKNTEVLLGYRFNLSDSFTEETFEGINQRESIFTLKNPMVDNRIQLKLTLNCKKGV